MVEQKKGKMENSTKRFGRIPNPLKWFRSGFIPFFPPAKGVLLYLGLHTGDRLKKIFRKYRSSYGFEANPALFEKLEDRFKGQSRVHLVHAAVAEHHGEIDFNISNQDGGSSSIGVFHEDWNHYRDGKIFMIDTVRVPTVNLYDFCQEKGIDYIDDYVSDIQGMDLAVLKTMKPMIDNRRIGTITCEVSKNSKGNIYKNLPDNSESGFSELLEKNYTLVAKGWGTLRNHRFDEVPEQWWEMDCKWRLKEI